jgi:hypothetical protein
MYADAQSPTQAPRSLQQHFEPLDHNEDDGFKNVGPNATAVDFEMNIDGDFEGLENV